MQKRSDQSVRYDAGCLRRYDLLVTPTLAVPPLDNNDNNIYRNEVLTDSTSAMTVQFKISSREKFVSPSQNFHLIIRGSRHHQD